jgi:hypothetical protein
MMKKGSVRVSLAFRLWIPSACVLMLASCGLQSGPKLDATDRKFAGFYSDYLVRSGTTSPDSSAQGVVMNSRDLDTLFVRHGIDQKSFDAKLRAYSKDPALWREVLMLVRKDLRRQQ